MIITINVKKLYYSIFCWFFLKNHVIDKINSNTEWVENFVEKLSFIIIIK